jgi:hypothetical protein
MTTKQMNNELPESQVGFQLDIMGEERSAEFIAEYEYLVWRTQQFDMLKRAMDENKKRALELEVLFNEEYNSHKELYNIFLSKAITTIKWTT